MKKGEIRETGRPKKQQDEILLPKKKELMSETVYQAVRNMVFLNRFKPGRRLNVERLARELGVSRTPAWEAVRRLEQEGIVRTVPNRGVFMRENSLARVYEQMEVLGALDPMAGRLACGRITEQTIRKLMRCMRDQLKGIEVGDLVLYGAAEMQFHRLLYVASGNKYLAELFDSVTLQMLPSRLNHIPALPSIYLTHQEIIEGLKNRDPDRVEKALNRHIEIMLALIKEQMRSDAERKEIVRQIKKDSIPLSGSRK